MAPRALLDRSVDDIGSNELALALLLALRSLDAHDAAVDLALGAGLTRLGREFGVRRLGHAREADFAPARLGVSGSHVKELRQVAKRLPGLPLLERAFLSVDLARARLRLVLRVATPETEGGWLVQARRLSTRELEQAVRGYRRKKSPRVAKSEEALEREESDEGCLRVGWYASAFDASLFRSFGRAMVRQVAGHPVKDWQVAEALAAEALTVVDDLEPESSTFRHLIARAPRSPAGRGSGGGACLRTRPVRARTDRELAALADRAGKLLRGEPVDLGLPDIEAPTDAWALLDTLRDLVAERHGLEAERARLLGLACGRGIHRRLGFRTFDDFAQHALGLAPRDVSELMRLDDRLLLLPLVRDAWLNGCVSRLSASLLSRVAEMGTESQWLSWAADVSFKRLETEIEWHLAQRAALPREQYLALCAGLPLEDVSTSALRLNWRGMFGRRGKAEPAAEPAGDPAEPGNPEPEPEPDPEPEDDEPWDSLERSVLRGIRWGRRVRVSFKCPRDVAGLLERAVRCVSREMGGAADIASCIRWMLLHFAETHASPEHEARWRSHPILERDGWTCSMPHCRAVAGLHVHHVRPRSRGGPLESWNEMAGCDSCHLHVVHAGHARTEGRAPDELVAYLGNGETWRDERLIAHVERATPAWQARRQA